MIHRPAVGSTLGDKASPSLISVADSSKHAIQIIQLLEERSMSFSFCVNKNEMLTLCGLSILYQGLDLKKESKLLKDGQRLVSAVENYLDAFKAPGAADFRKLVSSLASTETSKTIDREAQNHATAQSQSQTGRQVHPSVTPRYPSNLDTELLQQQERMRRATLNSIPMLGLGNQSGSRHKKPDTASRSNSFHSSTPRQSQLPTPSPMSTSTKPRSSSNSDAGPNLNYLVLDSTSSADGLRRSRSVVQQRNNEPQIQQYKTSNLAASDWESLLGSLDSGNSNIFDAVYGASVPGMPVSVSHGGANVGGHHAESLSSSGYGDWDLSPETWDMTALSMGDCDVPATTQSVLSISEESLSSGDDLDFGGPGVLGDYKHSLLQGGLNGDGFYVDGLDGNFGLS